MECDKGTDNRTHHNTETNTIKHPTTHLGPITDYHMLCGAELWITALNDSGFGKTWQTGICLKLHKHEEAHSQHLWRGIPPVRGWCWHSVSCGRGPVVFWINQSTKPIKPLIHNICQHILENNFLKWSRNYFQIFSFEIALIHNRSFGMNRQVMVWFGVTPFGFTYIYELTHFIKHILTQGSVEPNLHPITSH